MRVSTIKRLIGCLTLLTGFTFSVFGQSNPVNWTDTVGVAIQSDNSLIKTGSSGSGGASSEGILAANADGWAEFTAHPNGSKVFFGLSETSTNNYGAGINYAIRISPNNDLGVREDGNSMGSFGYVTDGDVLRIEVSGTEVKYMRNGLVFYTSNKYVSTPLRVDVDLVMSGATVTGAQASFAKPVPFAAAYHFNKCAGTMVEDSISGLNGTIHGPIWSAGYTGQGLRFDGVNDYVEIPDSDNTNFGVNDFTVAFWLKKLSSSSHWENSEGIGKWNTGGQPGSNEWSLSIGAENDDRPSFSIEADSTLYKVVSPSEITLNSWHHLAGVRDSSQIKLYQDGVLVATQNVGSAVVNNTDLPIFIGRIAAGYYSKAIFDELNIYNRALSATEIGDLANTKPNPMVCNGLVDDIVEIEALRDLYDSTDGANWTDQSGWPTTAAAWDTITSIDQAVGWYGVTVAGGDIVKIDLTGDNLSGLLPESLGNFKAVHTLKFGDNDVSGTIPATLFSLDALKNVFLNNNNLSGKLSDSIRNLTKLEFLELQGNKLEGTLPSSLGTLTHLNRLLLQDNRFNGTIPSSLGKLKELSFLYLGQNEFTGIIPDSLGEMRNLTQLRLSDNHLTGRIPVSLSNLTHLLALDLSNNSLVGNIPSQMGDLSELLSLDLSKNGLTGRIPDSFGELFQLTNLTLNDNDLHGEIPSSIGALPHLRILMVNNNSLRGAVPSGLVSLSNFIYAYLYNNQFTSFPNFTDGVNASGLKIVTDNNKIPLSELEQNYEAGFVSFRYSPQQAYYSAGDTVTLVVGDTLKIDTHEKVGATNTYSWEKFENGDWVDINSENTYGNGQVFEKRIVGLLDSGYYRYTINNSVLNMQVTSGKILVKVNLVADSIEVAALRDLFLYTNGKNWTDHTGWPTNAAAWDTISSVDQLAGWYGVTITDGDITGLDLYHNNLSAASLPEAILQLTSLQSLNLGNNSIGGTIPATIRNLSSLEELILSGNDFTGQVPVELDSLANLTSLNLSNTNITGPFPDLSQLTNLKTLVLHDLADQLGFTAIPSWIQNLSQLTNLTLSGTHLNGQLPEWIGALNKLQVLKLDLTQLSGTLPDTIGNLTSLHQLFVNGNQMSGTLPSSLGDLTSLSYLYLYGNIFRGRVPDELLQMNGLSRLYLSNNAFTGFPDFHGHASPEAIQVTIQHNYIPPSDIEANLGIFNSFTYDPQDSIPAEQGQALDIAEIEALHDLYESTDGANWTDNSGWPTTAAAWDSITSVRQVVGWYGITVDNGDIRDISLGSNGLAGEIPSSIENLKGLNLFALEHNDLSGEIPSSIGNLKSLVHLNLMYNNLSGQIPEEIGQCTNLVRLYLAENNLSGSLPDSLGNLNKLYLLHLRNNNLSGNLPSSLTQLTNLGAFTMRGNSFTGSFPYIGSTRLYNLELNDNEFTSFPDYSKHPNVTNLNISLQNNYIAPAYIGANLKSDSTYNFKTFTYIPQKSIPTEQGQALDIVEIQALRELYDNTDGANWTDNSGWPSTPLAWDSITSVAQIVGWYGITVESGDVTEINLGDNQLTGTIPKGIGGLISLTELHLNDNQLSGLVPPELGNLSATLQLDLERNALSGSIPSELGNLAAIHMLMLGHNNLSDSIPTRLSELNTLLTLDLSYNQLSGAIPPELGNLTSLQRLTLINNQLSGAIPADLGNLTSLLYLRLENNQLSGSVPGELGRLTTLKGLFLSHNQLSGRIPPEIGDLASLESLFLDSNQLTDSIPSEIGSLQSLKDLRLQFNQLSGALPATIGDLQHLSILYLHYNELNSALPESIGKLPELEYFDANNNNFVGAVPDFQNASKIKQVQVQFNPGITDLSDFSSISTLSSLYVKNTTLSFDDLERNLSISNFYYSPQENPVKETHLMLQNGDSIKNDRSGGEHTVYQWQMWNGTDWTNIAGAMDQDIVPSSIVEGDKFRCVMTNDLFPDMTLYSSQFTIDAVVREFYVTADGDWSDVTIWSDAEGNPQTEIPATHDIVYVNNSYAVQVTQEVECGEIRLDGDSPGKVEVAGGHLIVNGKVLIKGLSAEHESLVVNKGGKIECK